jgi:phosphoenolpyruvate carboxykinase (ATP)
VLVSYLWGRRGEHVTAHHATGLEHHGITTSRVYWNPSAPALYEEAVRRREAIIPAAPCVPHRPAYGRSPERRSSSRSHRAPTACGGKVNRPIAPRHFDALHQRLLNYVEGRELFVQDCYAGADPRYRLAVRVITDRRGTVSSPGTVHRRA